MVGKTKHRYQAVRVYSSGMQSVKPVGSSIEAYNESEALRIARKRYAKVKGSKIEVWKKK